MSNPSNMIKVAVVGGEGIGPHAVLNALDKVAGRKREHV